MTIYPTLAEIEAMKLIIRAEWAKKRPLADPHTVVDARMPRTLHTHDGRRPRKPLD